MSGEPTIGTTTRVQVVLPQQFPPPAHATAYAVRSSPSGVEILFGYSTPEIVQRKLVVCLLPGALPTFQAGRASFEGTAAAYAHGADPRLEFSLDASVPTLLANLALFAINPMGGVVGFALANPLDMLMLSQQPGSQSMNAAGVASVVMPPAAMAHLYGALVTEFDALAARAGRDYPYLAATGLGKP
jgi:hypothetical protein